MCENTKGDKMHFKDWVPLIVIIFTLAGSAWTWMVNEKSKRVDEEFKRKEIRYVNLINAARGFYSGSTDKNLQLVFLKQVDLCWLYCPDDVILKAYSFLNSVHKEASKQYSSEKLELIQKQSLQELILAVRKDLINRKKIKETKLKPEDFRILKPNQ